MSNTQNAKSETVIRVKRVAPGDVLVPWRRLVALHEPLRPLLGGLLQFRFVLDTNSVISDLLAIAKPHRNQNYRTRLQDLAASGTIVPYAPNELKGEIERHWPAVAAKNGIAPEIAVRVWQEYQKGLRFCAVVIDPRQRSTSRDPDDLPFIALAAQIGAHGIVSKDRDIPAMGGHVITVDLCVMLRDYTQHKAVEVAIQFGGAMLTTVTLSALIAVTQVIQLTVKGFMRLPPWLQLMLLLGVLWAAHDKQRRATFMKMIRSWGVVLTETLEGPLREVLGEMADAKALALQKTHQIKQALGKQKRRPLRTIIHAILAGDVSLNVPEIELRVREAGYRTKARDFQAYLRRVLGRDASFARTPDGRWRLRKHAPCARL